MPSLIGAFRSSLTSILGSVFIEVSLTHVNITQQEFAERLSLGWQGGVFPRPGIGCASPVDKVRDKGRDKVFD